MLTTDLHDVKWSHSRLKICSFLTAQQVRDIQQSDDHGKRAVAHAELKARQIRLLYDRESERNSAAFRASLGRRIVQTDSLEFCEGLVEARLYRIFGRFKSQLYGHTWTRRDLLKALLKGS